MPPQDNSGRKLLLGAGVLVVVAIGVWWWTSGSEAPPPVARQPVAATDLVQPEPEAPVRLPREQEQQTQLSSQPEDAEAAEEISRARGRAPRRRPRKKAVEQEEIVVEDTVKKKPYAK